MPQRAMVAVVRATFFSRVRWRKYWRSSSSVTRSGRFSIMPGQGDDRADIAGLGFGGVTVELHILQETFT